MFDTYETIFSLRADRYDSAMARWPQARKAEFEMALEPLPLEPGTVLCDMPAGGGYLRRYLPEGVGYLAVEPSDHFFAQCPVDAGASRLQCPVTAVAREDASVDYLVSLAGLHHVPDLDAVFAEMRRLVKPGGWVVIADVQAGSASDAFLNGFVHRHNPLGHVGVFFDERTPGRLAKAGLRVVEDRMIAPRWMFGSSEDMGAYCRSLFGIELASPAEIARELEATLGIVEQLGEIGFGWPLRRFVCRAA